MKFKTAVRGAIKEPPSLKSLRRLRRQRRTRSRDLKARPHTGSRNSLVSDPARVTSTPSGPESMLEDSTAMSMLVGEKANGDVRAAREPEKAESVLTADLLSEDDKDILGIALRRHRTLAARVNAADPLVADLAQVLLESSRAQGAALVRAAAERHGAAANQSRDSPERAVAPKFSSKDDS